jgi:hypothetical protein
MNVPTYLRNAIQGYCAAGFLKNPPAARDRGLDGLDLSTMEGMRKVLHVVVTELPCISANFLTAAEITEILRIVAQNAAGAIINSGDNNP